MKHSLVLIFVVIITAISGSASENKPVPITAQELLASMGGYSFVVRLPDKIGETSMISLRLRDSKGVGKYLTGASNASKLAGTLVRVVLIPQGEDTKSYRCVLITDNFTLSQNNKIISTSTSSKNPTKIYGVDSQLIRFSLDAVNSSKEFPEGDDVDVIVSLSK